MRRSSRGGPAVVEDVTYRNIRVECDGLEECYVLQRSRDERFTRKVGPELAWLSVENVKMCNSYGMQKNADAYDYTKEPFGTFRMLTVENVDLILTNGAKKPVRRIVPHEREEAKAPPVCGILLMGPLVRDFRLRFDTACRVVV